MLVRINRAESGTHGRDRERAYTNAGVGVRTQRAEGLGQFPKTMAEWEDYWKAAADITQADKDRPTVEFMQLVYENDAELRLLVERGLSEKEIPSVIQKVVFLNQQIQDAYGKLLRNRATFSEKRWQEVEGYKLHWEKVYNYAAGGLGVETSATQKTSTWFWVALLLIGANVIEGVGRSYVTKKS